MNRVVPQGTYQPMPAVLPEWYSGLCTGMSLPVPADDERAEKWLAAAHRDHADRRGARDPQAFGHAPPTA